MVGDIAQLPPVGDKPLYHSMPKTDKQIQGHRIYQQFKKVVALTVNHRVDGNSSEQHLLGIFFSEHVMVNPHQLIGIPYCQELDTMYKIYRSLKCHQ